MAKPNPDPLKAEDLLDFAKTDSDFGFEMQVVAGLRENGFSCEHSGTYRDPVTHKVRQFDVRGYLSKAQGMVALAVECKNIRPSFPLLLSCVPRMPAEAFHDVFVYHSQALPTSTQSVEHITAERSAYEIGAPVAKKTDQVGRDSSGEFIRNDEATFEKLNQAVSSCHDLVEKVAARLTPPDRTVIVPVLVVPTGRLWQVNYDRDGALTDAPHQVAAGTLFLDHTWSAPGPFDTCLAYRLSHIEVITFEFLDRLHDRCFGACGFFR